MFKRSWSSRQAKTTFTVLQWNALADGLCTRESFPFTNPNVLNWDVRKPQLEFGLEHISPSLVVLEEIDRYEDVFKPYFEAHSYGSVFYPKSERDGTVLAWKVDEFQPIGPAEKRALIQNFTNFVLIQKLLHVASQKTIILAGTHLVSWIL
jgi:mRNA deadenylase 3'-5' endonuclease subunit Ccr4